MTLETVESFLTGRHSHLDPREALKNLDWKQAGELVGEAPHSIYHILNHMIFWQDVYLRRIQGEAMPSLDRPSVGWPGNRTPEDEGAWIQTVARFEQGLELAIHIARENDLDRILPTFRDRSLGEALTFLAIHNSHHVGQIVSLRQALGLWPQAKDEW